MEGSGDQLREELLADQGRPVRGREAAEHLGAEELLDRVESEECGEQRRHGRQLRDLSRDARRDAVRGETRLERGGQRRREARDHQREEDADRERGSGVLHGARHARRRAALVRRHRVHDRRPVRSPEHAGADTRQERDDRKRQVAEVHRQKQEADERQGDEHEATGRERLGAEAVGERARDGTRDEEPDGERDEVDAGPERCVFVRVAVQWQPDALQPDDQHELEAAAADRREESGEDRHRERADLEQAHLEHGRLRAQLHEDEDHEEHDAADDAGEDPGVAPAGRRRAVGLDAVGDGREERGEAHREDDVAGPVELALVLDPDLVQRLERPDGADDPDRHADEEDGSPVDGRQEPADDQSDERAGDGRDLVDAERHAALVGGERVGEDRGRVGEEHGAADALDQPPDDEPHGSCAALVGVEGESDRPDGEDDEPGVVDADAPVHVAEAAEGHDQHRGDEHVAHEHPQQVADVARGEGVQVDALEDGGQRDDDDRRVDDGHEHAERGVAQGDPLVAGVVFGDERRQRGDSEEGGGWDRQTSCLM